MKGVRAQMQRVLRVLAAFFVVLFIGGSSACGVEMSDVIGPKITIGIAYDLPNISLEHAEHFSGLNVSIATQVAHELGYSSSQITWVEASNATREDLLNNGHVDMIVGVHEANNGTTDDVTFSQPYLTMQQALMVRSSDSSSLQSVQSLSGKSVCTIEGDSNSQLSSLVADGSTRQIIQRKYSSCITALFSGTVDGVMGDNLILASLAAATGGNFMTLVDDNLQSLNYGIALPEGDYRLEKMVNSAVVNYMQSSAWITRVKKLIESAQDNSLQSIAKSYKIEQFTPYIQLEKSAVPSATK